MQNYVFTKNISLHRENAHYKRRFLRFCSSPSKFKVLGGGYGFRTPKPINQEYVFDFHFEDFEMMILWPTYQTITYGYFNNRR